MTPEQSDPVIDDIHEIRVRLSARFGDDPKRIAEHLMELQERHRDRLIDSPRPRERFEEPAARP